MVKIRNTNRRVGLDYDNIEIRNISQILVKRSLASDPEIYNVKVVYALYAIDEDGVNVYQRNRRFKFAANNKFTKDVEKAVINLLKKRHDV